MIDPVRKIIFVHAEKTGGTSVERAFDAEILHGSTPPENRPWLQWQEQVLPWHGYRARYQKEWREYRKITLVRNPADRILSRHRYFLKADQALSNAAREHINGHGIWPELLKADIRYQTKGTFQQRNTLVNKLGLLPNYDFVMRLEKIDKDWPAMLDKLGITDLPRQFPHTNSSGEEVKILDVINEPHLRGKMAVALRPDLDAFHYSVASVSLDEQRAILKAMSGGCKGGGCDLLPFLQRVYPIAN